ncbi:hypothetical protein E0Z10_g6705 [Xylaria hypoxylon]|uniref:SCP domain-containing protein n=1 Tax=Xylaria hypoxylon TaxID=37992 RepID=A0A4Z0YUB9_9PEZI|nr:hypothetical protein E0Z10_g6705 [Xylaria hypoxylon]
MAKTPRIPEAKGPGTLFQFSIFTTLVLLTHPGFSQKTTTRVVTVAAAIPSTVPEFIHDETFTSAILNSTNVYRAAHNASDVVWNRTLEAFASDYLDEVVGTGCKFAHSGGPYGENLALGYPNATASVEAWGDEGGKYNFRKPRFSEATGHFTQLVWKNTTDVGAGGCFAAGEGGILSVSIGRVGMLLARSRTRSINLKIQPPGFALDGWVLPR